MDDDVLVTRHAKNRLKKRAGIKPSRQKKMAQRAYDEGFQNKHYKGRMKKYLDGYYSTYPREYARGSVHKVFMNLVWVFRGKTLVTVIRLPQWLWKYKGERG